MLMGVVGGLGSGKTSLLNYIASVTCQSTPLRGNLTFKYPGYEKIDASDFLRIHELGLPRLIFFGDELYGWLESRVSASKLNRALSYVIFQSRKVGMDVIYTAQLISSIDVRLRDLTDVFVVAEKKVDAGQLVGFKYTFVFPQALGGFKTRKFVLPAAVFDKIKDNYNTYERVLPFGVKDLQLEIDKANPAKLKSYINNTADLLYADRVDLALSLSSSKVDVECALIDKEFPVTYAAQVHAKLRQKMKNS